MLTFSESRQRTLNTPDEIATYLAEAFTGMQERSAFTPGQVVDIISRSGLSPEIGVGDVGVLLCDLPDQLFSWVLVFTASGHQLAIQVQTSNIAQRPSKEEEQT